MIFFDSHGQSFATCDATDEGAVAFGPTGTARPVNLELVGNGKTPFARAKALGKVSEGDDCWAYYQP